eukprot:5982841-Amphidinium_carterae.1
MSATEAIASFKLSFYRAGGVGSFSSACTNSQHSGWMIMLLSMLSLALPVSPRSDAKVVIRGGSQGRHKTCSFCGSSSLEQPHDVCD